MSRAPSPDLRLSPAYACVYKRALSGVRYIGHTLSTIALGAVMWLCQVDDARTERRLKDEYTPSEWVRFLTMNPQVTACAVSAFLFEPRTSTTEAGDPYLVHLRECRAGRNLREIAELDVATGEATRFAFAESSLTDVWKAMDRLEFSPAYGADTGTETDTPTWTPTSRTPDSELDAVIVLGTPIPPSDGGVLLRPTVVRPCTSPSSQFMAHPCNILRVTSMQLFVTSRCWRVRTDGPRPMSLSTSRNV